MTTQYQIKVTPAQSEELQNLLFKVGWQWSCGTRGVANTDVQDIVTRGDKKFGGNCSSRDACDTTILLEDFIAEYLPEAALQQAKEAVELAMAKYENLLKEVEALKKASAKVELKGGGWTIYSYGITEESSDLAYKVAGAERQTKELAESARKEIIRFQRMLAYVDEHGGHKEFIHEDINWCVYYNMEISEWEVQSWMSCRFQTVWMSEEVATKLCEDLNSGRFTLDLPEA